MGVIENRIDITELERSGGGGGGGTAASVSYDNTSSHMTAKNVQAAIDELNLDMGSFQLTGRPYYVESGDGVKTCGKILNDLHAKILTALSGATNDKYFKFAYAYFKNNGGFCSNVISEFIRGGTTGFSLEFNKNSLSTTGMVEYYGYISATEANCRLLSYDGSTVTNLTTEVLPSGDELRVYAEQYTKIK